MATVRNNQLLSGVRGSIDGIVIKQYKFGTVMSKKPDMRHVKHTALQKNKQSLFADAVAFSKGIIRDPVKKAIYAKNLKDGQRVFNAAVSAYLKEHAQEN